MSNPWTLEQELGIYAKYVGWIAEERENWETFAWEALILRSGFEERWSELTESQRLAVRHVDDLLAANHQRLQEILPGAGRHPRSEWWWYLHEGANVRPEVRQIA